MTLNSRVYSIVVIDQFNSERYILIQNEIFCSIALMYCLSKGGEWDVSSCFICIKIPLGTFGRKKKTNSHSSCDSMCYMEIAKCCNAQAGIIALCLSCNNYVTNKVFLTDSYN